MGQAKPSRMRRAFSFVVFRVVPFVLIIASALTAYSIAQSAFRYLSEQRLVAERAPLYQATASALAETLTGTPAADDQASQLLVRLVKRQPAAEQSSDPGAPAIAQFATNTPHPPAPTETPEPVFEITITPRPLPTLFIYGQPNPDQVAATAIPTPVEPLDRRGYDLMNILLLGNDGEITGDGFVRTDTMIIVSINRTTNSVAMLSLPRDLYVYIPGWTMQRLNAAFMRGEAGGWTDGGFGLMRQTIFYNFGINVHYYAMVDLTGFKAIVDAVGGVNLAVDCAIRDYQLVEAEVPSGAYRYNEDGEYVLPVGYYRMSGAEALWYARSRRNSSDFDRGRRQQQLLRAVWREARDRGLLTQVPQLWAEASPYIQTNMTLEDLLGLVPVAASLDPSRIESFTFARLYHTTPWQTPDGDFVQLPVYETVRQMLIDFYSPPTESQLVSEAATVAVYNASGNPNWDRVAAERLAWSGFNAVAMGDAPGEMLARSMMIDYTGRSKGSSLQQIAGLLNVRGEDLRIEPSATRDYDFEVFIGQNYNSCTEGGVLPVDAIGG
jgi:LCP family protein required for cell wall assembly